MAPVDRRILSRAMILGVLIAAVGLTACGRKGPLEPPPSAAAQAVHPGDPKAPAEAGPTKPDRPFLLDPLL